MTFGALAAIAWVVAGVVCALVVTVIEIRDVARKGERDSDEIPPAGVGIIFGVLVPLVVVILAVIGFYRALTYAGTRLARVDRLPEVRERKLREADRIMDEEQ